MKKWLKRIFQMIMLMVMAFSLVEIGSYVLERHRSDAGFDALNQQLADLKPVTTPVSEEVTKEAVVNPNLIDYDALMQRLESVNTDAVAYIDIHGSENQYPVMQSKDNEYYLRRGMDKEYSIQGTPFLDYRNASALTDQNSIVYAHMMNYGNAMFGIFRHYLDQEYVDQQPKTFSLTTADGVYTYRMFSLQHVWATDPYRIPNQEDEKFLDDMMVSLAKSEVDFGYTSDFTAKDRIATLSTCTTDHDDEKRIAILGILEKVETKEGTITRQDLMNAEADATWETMVASLGSSAQEIAAK